MKAIRILILILILISVVSIFSNSRLRMQFTGRLYEFSEGGQMMGNKDGQSLFLQSCCMNEPGEFIISRYLKEHFLVSVLVRLGFGKKIMV